MCVNSPNKLNGEGNGRGGKRTMLKYLRIDEVQCSVAAIDSLYKYFILIELNFCEHC